MALDQFVRTFRGARCLVVGGAGFIGSNLSRTLVEMGARVSVLDNLSTGKRENLEGLDGVVLIEEDLVSCEGLEKMVAGTDYVFHLAAVVGNLKSIEWPEEDARTNILGSVRLYNACRATDVKKVVYSSSSAMFGEAAKIPIDEGATQIPESFYALSKMTGERYALLAHALWSVPAVCLRYFNVYGLPMEYNEYTGVISIFFDRLQEGRPLVIYGDGEQYRDFVYVQDVAQANLRAAAIGEPGGVYNIGSGQKTSIRELAEAMMELTDRKAEIRYEDFRPGEVRRSLADIGHARAELGFEPEFDLRRGLAKMWEGLSAGKSRKSA